MRHKKTNTILLIALGGLMITSIGYVAYHNQNLTTTVINTDHFNGGKVIQGNGQLQTINKQLASYNQLDIGGNFALTVKTGAPSMQLTIDSNLLPYVTISDASGKLTVKFKDGFSLHSQEQPKLVVTSNHFNRIQTGGNINIDAQSLSADELQLGVGGNTNGQLQTAVTHLTVDAGGNTHLSIDNNNADSMVFNVGGNSDFTLSGKTKSLQLNTGGMSHFHAKNLLADDVKLAAAGSMTASVSASNKLTVTGFGSGSVTYYGHPKQVDNNMVGHLSLQKG